MLTVLIDTSAYEAQQLSFEGYLFNSLRKLSDDGKIQLATSSIIEREILRHLTETIAQSVNKVAKTAGTFDRVTRDNLGEISMSLTDVPALKTRILASRAQTMKDFFANCACIDVDERRADVVEILDDYFSGRPPFNEAGKPEFPDAILLNAYVRTFEEQLNQCALVSADNDWKRFSQNYPQITFFASIGDFVDFVNTKYDLRFTTQLKLALVTSYPRMIKAIQKAVDDDARIEFTSDWIDPDAVISPNSITSEIQDSNLITLTEDSADWEIKVLLRYAVDVSATDPDTWYRDSDTKETGYYGSSQYELTYAGEVEINVSTRFEPESIDTSLEIEDVVLPDEIFFIDTESDSWKCRITRHWNEDDDEYPVM